MKFAHYLSTLERDAPQEWQGRFIQYKKLKKMLKACLVADESDLEDEGQYMVDKDKEDEFFKELEVELQAVNKHFFNKADRTVARYQRRTRGVLAFVLYPIFALKSEKSINELAKDAYWCRKYARANAVALRKILKKHDKTCKNRRGKSFLQECWALSSPDGIGVFLHSPLLDELKAVQEKLQMSLDGSGQVVDPNADRNEVYPLHPEKVAEEDRVRSIAAGTSMSRRRPGRVGAGDTEKADDIGDESGRDSGRDSGHESEDQGREGVHGSKEGGSDGDEDLETRKIYRLSIDQRSVSGSVLPCNNGNDETVSGTDDVAYTHSLEASRQDALRAIEQATTCLLDSSDIDWEDDTPLHSDEDAGAPEWPVPTEDGTFVERLSTGCAARDKQKRQALDKETYKRGVDPDTLGFSPAKSVKSQRDVQSANTHPSASNHDSSMAGASATYDEGDFKCPICLELMYRPVGLSCGHKFCRQCALDAAGFGKVFGAFRNIISYIPARITCPECRQAKAYKGAVSLKELGFLIRDRYPKEYAERRSEEREHRRNMALRETVPHDSSRPFYPFDLLHI